MVIRSGQSALHNGTVSNSASIQFHPGAANSIKRIELLHGKQLIFVKNERERYCNCFPEVKCCANTGKVIPVFLHCRKQLRSAVNARIGHMTSIIGRKSRFKEGASSLIYQKRLKKHLLRGIFFRHIVQLLQSMTDNIVIAVEKKHVFSACVRKPGITRRRQSAVELVNGMNAFIRRGISVAEHPAAVGRAVIHKEHLPVSKRLVYNALNAHRQVFSTL